MTPSRRRWPLFAVALALATVSALKAADTASAKPHAKTSSTDATFRFSSSEPDSSFDCALDGAAFTPCSTPHQYTGLALGGHEFRVRAIDRAGNVDPTPAKYRWTIEPPGCGAAAGTFSAGALVRFSSPNLMASCELTFAGPGEDSADPDTPKETARRDPPVTATSPVEEPAVQAPARDPADGVQGSPPGPSSTVQASPSDCAGSLEIGAADGDAWVSQSSPEDNHGGESILKVDTRDGDNARSLVRFALPEIPTTCGVKSATLRLHSDAYREGRTLQALPLAGAWTESTVNWSNQPSTVGKAAEAPSRSSAGYVELDVTSQVLGMYTGTNNGFLVRDSAQDGGGLEQSFNSRERAEDNPPQLVITFGP